MKISLQLLGAAEIRQESQLICGHVSAKAKALLFYLAMTRRLHLRPHLAALLWGDYPETAARANLRKSLSELNECIGSFMVIERHLVGIRTDQPIWVDALQFSHLLEEANRQPQEAAAIALIQEALSLYRGDFLAGHYLRQAPEYEAWMLAERARLRLAMVQGLEKVADYFARQDDLAQAIAYTRQVLELEPWREETHRRLMLWLAQDGRRSEALAQYEICCKLLAEELAVGPSQATQQLYERLLRQDRMPPVPQHRIAVEHPLIGRCHEWQTLLACWNQTQRSGSHLVALVGEAGIGKTRLAEELILHLQRQGHAVAVTRAYPVTARVAYGPVAGWLRSEALQSRLSELSPQRMAEVARLVPELLDSHPEINRPAPLLDSWQQKQFLETLNDVFIGFNRPLLLLLDQIQWADNETIEWLPYFLDAAARLPLLIVVTVRPEEVDTPPLLHKLWSRLMHEGRLTTIEVPPLNEQESAELAATVAKRPLPPTVAACLYRETGGSPLFIIERVRTLIEQLAADEEWEVPHKTLALNGAGSKLFANGIPAVMHAHLALPAKVRAMLESRLALLSPQALAVAQLLACIGRASRVDMLVEASHMDEESVIAGLDELWQRRLVQEVSVAVYDFSHEHLRAAVYAMLSPVRRRHLHHHVAEAQVTLYKSNLAPIVGELAFHYEQGGVIEKAVDFYRRAAEQAQSLFAYAEVVNYLERALTALHMQVYTPASVEMEIDLLLDLGMAHIHTAGWGSTAAEEAWQRAYELVIKAGPPLQQCRTLLALDACQRHRGRFEQALAQSEAALTLERQYALKDPYLLHILLANHADALYHTGQPAQALALFEEALALAREPLQPTFAWFTLQPQLVSLRAAQCLWLLGRVDEARQRLARVLAAEPNCPGGQGSMLQLLLKDFSAMVHIILGETAAVLSLGEELIALGNQYSFDYFQHIGRIYTGWALAQQGDVKVGERLVRENVENLCTQEVRIFEPLWRSLLIDVLSLAGHLREALAEVDQTLAYTAQSENRFWDANLLKQRGDLLNTLGEAPSAVEDAYRQSLECARTQGARALERRAATALAHFLQQQRHSDKTRYLPVA